jgi:hypothetical protein
LCGGKRGRRGGVKEAAVLKQRDLAAERPSERGFFAVEAVLACLVVMILASVAMPRAMAL